MTLNLGNLRLVNLSYGFWKCHCPPVMVLLKYKLTQGRDPCKLMATDTNLGKGQGQPLPECQYSSPPPPTPSTMLLGSPSCGGLQGCLR